MPDVQNRPCAVPGLISYRYPSSYGGFIMIGAKDHDDALAQASRSISTGVAPTIDKLEAWDIGDAGGRYVSAASIEIEIETEQVARRQQRHSSSA